MSNQSDRKSLKNCVRHFTWAWHTIVMGTGAVAALVSRFHFAQDSEATKFITLVLFFLDLCFFVLICGATVARYYMFPELWSAMLRHQTQSLFIGAFPMGAATLINIALVAHQSYSFAGPGFLYFLWALWWLVSAISLLTAVGMIYVMMTKHQHSLSGMSALWILPMVTLIVSSSTGGLLASALTAHPTFVSLTTAISFTLLSMGLSLALMIITVYLMRLAIHGPLDAHLILSSFIILGPLGQGGFSLLVNSQNLAKLHLGASLSAEAIQSVCFCAAWVLWSMGLIWLCIAFCSIYSVLRRQSIPFSVAYWGIVFPNAVFALLTVELGSILDSPVLHYLGAIFSVLVFLLWIFVFLKTIPAIWNTTAFSSPCVLRLDEETLASSHEECA
ncbi:voltage-dependent anion channel [Mycena rosella]|uniref:Voltage-dependent anion channel n=1 Tax=Mycena rosella TaxID=1033263 RepID=A0AAD7GCJ8_MYCRO|nr:voltage-dependent anion channel [Mycena rosella]